MKVLIVGYGSIGKRHTKNLLTFGVKQIDVYDPFASGVESGVQFLKQIDAAANFYDACFICTPNDQHLQSLQKFYPFSRSFFIEKPVSISSQDREAFRSLNADQKTIMVGCNYRFEPTLNRLKKLMDEGVLGRILFFTCEFGHYLPSWRPTQDYRTNYAAKKETGGGVVLDRIHELDYLRWIFGDLVCESAVVKKVSQLEIDVEDIALIHLETKTGVIGSLHLDYLQPKYICKLKVVGEKSSAEWSFRPNYLKQFLPTGEELNLVQAHESDVNEMYRLQTEYFMKTIAGNALPMNDLDEAFSTVDLVDQIKAKANA